MTDDERELGALLVLLNATDRPFGRVHATYRIWRDEERASAAFHAHLEQQRRRGASLTPYAFASSDREAPETEETVRIWRDGARFREEHHGGRRDGYYAVADGPVWWFWDERLGASSNQDQPTLSSSVGQELQVMFDPPRLLSALRFRVGGRSEVAGRATVTADAFPRQQEPPGTSQELGQLGAGAHRYRLEVDQERGVLLAVSAIRDDRPFQTINTLAIRFDEPIPADTFQFEPPEGADTGTGRDGERLQSVTLVQAQQRAPFTVLMPDRVPDGWRARCMFIGASERLSSPAQVSLSYRSDDGHQSISISQAAPADGRSPYEHVISNDRWQETIRAGTTVRVTKPGSGQAQAHVERDGTFAFLVSDNLTADELVSIASSLRPVPAAGSLP